MHFIIFDSGGEKLGYVFPATFTVTSLLYNNLAKYTPGGEIYLNDESTAPHTWKKHGYVDVSVGYVFLSQKHPVARITSHGDITLENGTRLGYVQPTGIVHRSKGEYVGSVDARFDILYEGYRCAILTPTGRIVYDDERLPEGAQFGPNVFLAGAAAGFAFFQLSF